MAAPFALIFGEGLSEARFLCPSGTRNARFFVLRHRAWGTEGKRQPGGLLPPKAAKRPAGVSKYKGCARTARRTPIFARERNERWARTARRTPIFARERNERWARTAPSATIERPGVCPKPRQGAKGSVCPVGTWAKGPKRPAAHRREASARWAVAAKGGKATRRREQIQGLRAASAQNADICEGSETMSATVREARMIEQPGRPLHPIHSPCLPSLSQYSGKTCSNRSPYLSGSPPANVSRRA